VGGGEISGFELMVYFIYMYSLTWEMNYTNVRRIVLLTKNHKNKGSPPQT
jgi:hypothetical protein